MVHRFLFTINDHDNSDAMSANAESGDDSFSNANDGDAEILEQENNIYKKL